MSDFNPLLYVTRYDKNYENCADLYNNLPYKRDYDSCNGPIKESNSGNIIKYYLYQLQNDSYTVKDKPELMAKRLREYQEEIANTTLEEKEDLPSASAGSGITSEQMESLLADNSEEEDEED